MATTETNALYTPRDAGNVRTFSRWFIAAITGFITTTILLSGKFLEPGPVAWALTAVTIALLGMMVRSYVLFIREADELLRKIQLEALAISFGATVVFMMGYRLCERLGAPKLDVNDPMMVAAIMFAVWQWVGAQRYGGGEQ